MTASEPALVWDFTIRSEDYHEMISSEDARTRTDDSAFKVLFNEERTFRILPQNSLYQLLQEGREPGNLELLEERSRSNNVI